MSIPNFKLSDGHSIPALGLGAGKWFKHGEDNISEDAISTLSEAIKVGINHIDGAEAYRTDREVGQAIIKSGVDRSKLFITDKYFAGDKDFSVKSSNANPYAALKNSLGRLQLEYVDLYLLHSQHITKETHGFTVVEAWNHLEKLKDEGLAKSIGVSNFDIKSLTEILDSKPKYKPVINQIEYSPLLQNQSAGIIEFAKKNDILIEAYGALAPLLNPAKDGEDKQFAEYVESLAKTLGKSESQIVLRWVYETGILAVTSSSKVDRIKSYLGVFDFELTKEQHAKITELGALRKFQKYLGLAHKD